MQCWPTSGKQIAAISKAEEVVQLTLQLRVALLTVAEQQLDGSEPFEAKRSCELFNAATEGLNKLKACTEAKTWQHRQCQSSTASPPRIERRLPHIWKNLQLQRS